MLAYILAFAALMAAGFNLASRASCAKQEIFRESEFHHFILLQIK
jgi:hypothetical protein